tara:strand:+ start:4034 stop:5872 length:1839 start_codon:yes stop_codon:yes gene_type:complete
MNHIAEVKEEVTILFAGDSGDGMQLTGNQFTNTSAVFGNDVSTFPNFPAEIRAPQGTVGGVSGFQLQFGSNEVYTAGDQADVLVAMNAAALKANIASLKKGGILIANTDGFDSKNLKLAECENDNPLESSKVEGYRVYKIEITTLTKNALKESGLSPKDQDRAKNMFVLGVLYWMFGRALDTTIEYLEAKFKKSPELIDANVTVLKAGYHFGETSEIFSTRYEVKRAKLDPGTYRNVMGNQGAAIGLVAAAQKSGLELFYGTYPITPASDILHELSKHKNFGIKTFQAEDEIAAVASAIGASFGGSLGVTASSGPGIALKGEAIGLAVMLELPLVVINIQRGGPSTGLPTKTEQADLMQALYGRNGEAQLPVIAASRPADAFDAIYEATRIAVEHMTPVIFLSDGYIANGAEPWKFPESKDLKPITPNFVTEKDKGEEFLPYQRDERLVRKWAVPGMEGFEHRVGGLEKQDLTGNVSYDSDNHEKMVKIRAEKITKIADDIPEQTLNQGTEEDRILVLGWGSTYGAIKTAVKHLRMQGLPVAHTQLRYIHPFPKNLGELLAKFDKVLIPEINDGQLVTIIRDKFLIDAELFAKIKGVPFTAEEIERKVKSLL